MRNLVCLPFWGQPETPCNVIRFFPKETCSCPSMGRCYHIMAVRMSIGLDTASCKQRINLSQLRRNSISRKDKTSGRKRLPVLQADDIQSTDIQSTDAQSANTQSTDNSSTDIQSKKQIALIMHTKSASSKVANRHDTTSGELVRLCCLCNRLHHRSVSWE